MSQNLNFLWIGQPIIADQALEWPAKIVLALVATMCRENETTPGACTLSIPQLAEIVGMSENTMRHHLSNLIANGYLAPTALVTNGKVRTRELRLAKDVWTTPDKTIKIAAKHLLREDLSWLEKAVVSHIEGFYVGRRKDGKVHGFYQANETMAEVLGATVGSIKSIVCKLVKRGYLEPRYVGKVNVGKNIKYNGTRILVPTAKVKYPSRNPVEQVPQSHQRDPQSCLRDPAIPLTRPAILLTTSEQNAVEEVLETQRQQAPSLRSNNPTENTIQTDIHTLNQTDIKTRSHRSHGCDDISFLGRTDQTTNHGFLEEPVAADSTIIRTITNTTEGSMVSMQEVEQYRMMLRVEAGNFVSWREQGLYTDEQLLQDKRLQLSDFFVYCMAKQLGLHQLAREYHKYVSPQLQPPALRQVYRELFPEVLK